MNSVLILPQHCYTILCCYTHISHHRGSYQKVLCLCPLGSRLVCSTEWRSPGCCHLAMFQWKQTHNMCRYPKGFGDHRCVLERIPYELPVKSTIFGDEQTTLKDIKAPFLGPGVAAASERAAILDRYRFRLVVVVSWCGDIFLVHFGPLSTNWASFKRHSLPEYLLTMFIPLWLQCTHLLMATSSRIMHHVTKLKSSQAGFLNMTMSSLYSNVVEREIRFMDVQPTNLQQLRDAIMSIWTKISEECFQHLVESMPQIIKAVLKAKVVQPGTSKVYLIKWPVSVYTHIYTVCPWNFPLMRYLDLQIMIFKTF